MHPVEREERGVTRAAVARYFREQEQDQRAGVIAAWRARHPEATCRDATAFLLAVMEEAWGGKAPAA